jgi:endonuclease-3
MYRKNKDVPRLLAALKKTYPAPVCALNHQSAFQLLVATILSAQCTDERVNMVTPALFKRYPTPRALADSAPLEVEALIRSTGFYRNKAKSIRGMAKMLVEQHGGDVPKEMEPLLELPGVARKTANVVLGTAFGKAEGVVVDTHVTRLSNRLGLTKELAPEKIEKDLMVHVPRADWIWFSHALITHGRRVCKARAPECPVCPVRRECANPVALVPAGSR